MKTTSPSIYLTVSDFVGYSVFARVEDSSWSASVIVVTPSYSIFLLEAMNWELPVSVSTKIREVYPISRVRLAPFKTYILFSVNINESPVPVVLLNSTLDTPAVRYILVPLLISVPPEPPIA